MFNDKMYKWLRKLAYYEPFQDCINLSENPLIEQYDVELLLRFLVFSKINPAELHSLGDVGIFVTNRMIQLARDPDFKYDTWGKSFTKTFDLLNRTVGPNSFRKYNLERKKYTGGFVLSPFEVIAFGLGFNDTNPPADDKIDDLVKSVWSNPTLNQWSGSGITATRRLPRLIPLGRELFKG